jgi:hypothetical protein
MLKAIKAVQRSYQRAPYRAFVLSQKQHASVSRPAPVPDRAVTMEHKTKAAGGY